MIAMRPINEPAVVDELNGGRYEGDVRGFVVMDGPAYQGHMLYAVGNTVTTVLECGLQQTPLVDGAVRACVAAGENAGTTHFCLNENDTKLQEWRKIFCKSEPILIENAKIFHECK